MVGALHAEIKEKGTSNQGFWLKSRFLAKIKENGQLSRFLAKPDEEGPGYVLVVTYFYAR